MTLSNEDLFRRYMYAGAVTRDPAAVAELFTQDGVYEAPLVPDGHVLTRRLEGRDAIREGIAVYHREVVVPGTLNPGRSRSVTHATTDPDVFLVELDAVFDTADGEQTVSLVQIFRVRDGLIVELRDYFRAP